jgi:DNA processing protein
VSGETAARDARVLALLSISLPGLKNPAAPLGVAEWRRMGGELRRAGLTRPGDLLDVGPGFWPGTGLTGEEIARLQSLLARGEALDQELERLRGLGIRVITSVDPGYPARLRARLRGLAPPVLFGAGAWALLEQPGLAIVGSRGVDEEGAVFTRAVAARCARDGLAVVTGGAKGVDQIAMRAALEGGGSVIGVPAGDLERIIKGDETRRWIEESRLLLLSPVHPKVGFSVANAMARNKIVYALAEYGLVVSSAVGQGGTWAGAREVLRHGWAPLFVRDAPSTPEGNRELLRPAARPFPALEALGDVPLGSWLAGQVAPPAKEPPVPGNDVASEEGQDLFSLAWPRLALFLETPRFHHEVAAAFHLVPAQASAWARRAVTEGKATQGKGRFPRYQSVTEPPPLQLRLLERSPGYRALAPVNGGSRDGWSEIWPGADSE